MATPPPEIVAPAAPARVYRFDEFTLDVAARKLLRGNTASSLPSRAFDALVYLIERRDRLVQKNELIDAIWSDVVVTDDSLTHAVSVVRRALADERAHPRYIETVPRRGYRFIAAVRTDEVEGKVEPTAGEPDALQTTAPVAAPLPPSPRSRPHRPRRLDPPVCYGSRQAQPPVQSSSRSAHS
jgi:DNA-binding winged helix-turn-helix (wHTH) protein